MTVKKATSKRVPVCPKAINKDYPKIRAAAQRHLKRFQVDLTENKLLARIHKRTHGALCKAHTLAKKSSGESYPTRFIAALVHVAGTRTDTVGRLLRQIADDLSQGKAGTG